MFALTRLTMEVVCAAIIYMKNHINGVLMCNVILRSNIKYAIRCFYLIHIFHPHFASSNISATTCIAKNIVVMKKWFFVNNKSVSK